MKKHPTKKSLLDAYRVPGFRARARVEAYAHEPPAFVITLNRRQKKRRAADVVKAVEGSMIAVGTARATSIAAITRFISTLNIGAWFAKGAAA